MGAWPDYVIIADPASLRLEHYLSELHSFLESFSPRPNVRVVPWLDLIAAEGDLSKWVPDGTFLLRVESPARDFEIFRQFLRRGEMELNEIPSVWPYEKGWIASPRRLHLGFCRILSNLARWVAEHPACWPTSDLRDTQLLFDKNRISELLAEQEIATPESFRPDMLESVQEPMVRGWATAYVKLAQSSCASGIARVQYQRAASYFADTTISEIGDRFYNSYRLRTVEGNAAIRILLFLIQENATIQRAVDKTQIQGDKFDVRVVVVGGKVVTTVFRASPLPITNLHLGGYRADPNLCRRVISDRSWADAMDHCRSAARLFGMASLGIDLAFDRETNQGQILEINSFGDFLPHWRDERGRSLHRIEIESTGERFVAGSSVESVVSD